MIVTRNISVTIRVYHDIVERQSYEPDRMSKYFENHGWTSKGGASADGYYDGFMFCGFDDFQKSFPDHISMQKEVEEIELLFHRGEKPVKPYKKRLVV